MNGKTRERKQIGVRAKGDIRKGKYCPLCRSNTVTISTPDMVTSIYEAKCSKCEYEWPYIKVLPDATVSTVIGYSKNVDGDIRAHVLECI